MENGPDNTKLVDLIKKMDAGLVEPEIKNEFLELFKVSQLFMPVMMGENIFESLENAKVGDVIQPEGQLGFDINYLRYGEDKKAVPLFTSSELMESTGLKSSAIAIFMSDLADMLKQTDRYSMIAINPYTDLSIEIPMESFMNLFLENPLKTMMEILKMLEEKSVELEEDYVFFVRDSEPFMKNDAVDGVFRPNIPFNISTRKDFKEELEYLNVLLMPKTTKILFIGNVVDENHYDTIIAPGSEFHFVEDVDEYTSVWKCGAQPFYDE